MRAAAAEGAFLEFVYNGLIGPGNPSADDARLRRGHPPGGSAIIAFWRATWGRPANPLHPDGLAAFFAGLMREGISAADIATMSKTNPARALGLE